MINFIFFLIKIVVINAILFVLIAIISIKLKLIFKAFRNQKDGLQNDEDCFVDETEIDEQGIIVFGTTGLSTGIFLKSENRIGGNLFSQNITFVTPIKGFPERYKFNTLVREFAKKHGFEVELKTNISYQYGDIEANNR
jgi:hypothetical protein